jgi:predicted MFS family arabinose efflux permease
MRVTTLDESSAASDSLYTRSFILLLATQSCYGMSFSAFFLLPKYLKAELLATDLQIGAIGAVGAVTGVLAFPLVGALNDRHGFKPFMLFGSFLMMLSALATLLLTRIDFVIYGLRLLHGISFALLFNSTTTLMAQRVLPERLGVALGVFGSSMLITNALAPALSETLANRVGWPLVFWVAAGWGVLSMLLGLFVDEPPRDRRTVVSTAPSLLSERRTWVVALAISGAGAGFGTVFTFHQPYALSLGMRAVSGFFVAYAFAALVGRMLLLSRIDHLDRRAVSAMSMLLYAAAVAGAAWLRPVVLECIGLVLGLAHGVLYPVFNALAIQGVRPAQRGSMMALYHGGFNGGMAVALVIGGSVVEALGYPMLFWLTGVATALAALYLARSPELRDARHH